MAEWRPIDELFDYEKGTLQSSKCTPGKYTFITAAEEWKTHETFTHDCEALIFAMAASGSLGRTHYVKGKFISSDLCFILTPKKGLRLDLTFYHRLFNFLRTDIVRRTATGTSKLAINQTNFGAYKLPYFEYAHQLSFRDKIETIRGINEKFFDGMDFQLSLLDKLRQAVLQEAIEGKLTAEWRKQNPMLISGENHASKLLEKICTEKDCLVKEGKIRKEKPLSAITDDEKPFTLPDGWTWCHMGELLESTFYGPRFGKDEYVKEGIPTIRTTDMHQGRILLNDPPNVAVASQSKTNLYRLVKGDILITRTGTIGEYAFFDEDYLAFPSAYLIRCRLMDTTLLGYVLKLISSPLMQRHLGLNTQKGTKPNINADVIRTSLVPLPPIAEQQAIVDRVDKFLAMVDELEKQVVTRQKQSELLMQSVLREAFEHEHA
jgi:type I restriction enzyme S subunit